MGTWGTGFRDNDNYYNELPEVVDPLIEQVSALLNPVAADGAYPEDFDALRRRTCTVWSLLAGIDDIQLDADQLDILRQSADHIAAAAEQHSSSWNDPDKYAQKAADEARARSNSGWTASVPPCQATSAPCSTTSITNSPTRRPTNSQPIRPIPHPHKDTDMANQNAYAGAINRVLTHIGAHSLSHPESGAAGLYDMSNAQLRARVNTPINA